MSFNSTDSFFFRRPVTHRSVCLARALAVGICLATALRGHWQSQFFASLTLPLPFRQVQLRSRSRQVVGASAAAADHLKPADPQGAQLLEWLELEGATVWEGLGVAIVPPLGRELVAMEAVDAGEKLVLLPPELCLAAPSAEQFSVPDEDIRLARALLDTETSSFWRAYRSVWPAEDMLREILPIFWADSRVASEARAGKMPGLVAQVRSRRRLLRRAANRLGVSVEQLTWAHALVATRAVGASVDACAMLPGVDLANHSPEPNAEIVVAGTPGERIGKATRTKTGEVWEHGSAGLVAKKDIAAGEVIRISYGKYPNQRLILDYGFSLGAANPGGNIETDDESGGLQQ